MQIFKMAAIFQDGGHTSYTIAGLFFLVKTPFKIDCSTKGGINIAKISKCIIYDYKHKNFVNQIFKMAAFFKMADMLSLFYLGGFSVDCHM